MAVTIGVCIIVAFKVNAQVASNGTIVLTVTDARPLGAPPGDIYVYDQRTGGQAAVACMGQTTHVFDGLAPGPYLLYSASVKRWYPNVPFQPGAEPVYVQAGATTAVTWVRRFASLHCTAWNNERSRIVSNVILRLHTRDGRIRGEVPITRGSFTLAPVSPGDYYLSVTPWGNDADDYLPTWHPCESTQASAELLRVADNEEITVTTQMRRAQAHASGVVRAHNELIANVDIIWAEEHGARYCTQSDSNGSYRLALQSGTYIISAVRRGLLPEFYPGSHAVTGAVPVAISSNQHCAIDFAMDYGVSVGGTITNFTYPERVTVFALDAHHPEVIQELRSMQRPHARTNFPSSDCTSDGKYFIGGLSAGLYRICAEEYTSSGMLPVNWGYHVSALVWEDARVLTAEHASVAFSNILVGRGVTPAPLSSITGIVYDATLASPLSGVVASTSYDRRTTGSDGKFVLPCRSSNVVEASLGKTGFASFWTNMWALHDQTVQLARTAIIECQVEAPGESLSASVMVALDTNSCSVASTGVRVASNQFIMHVPHGVPLRLFLCNPQVMWLHENSFLDGSLSPAEAHVLELAEGQWTTVTFRLHARIASLTTTVYHSVNETVTVTCLDTPLTYALDAGNRLTQQYEWLAWNLPPNGRFDHSARRFEWHSDGTERHLMIGRFPALPDMTTYGLKGGGGTIVHLYPVPEGGLVLAVVLTTLYTRYRWGGGQDLCA